MENIFFQKNNSKEKLLRGSTKNFNENKSIKINIENIEGNFIVDEKISYNSKGVFIISTIKKNGHVFFGERLYDVKFIFFYFKKFFRIIIIK